MGQRIDDGWAQRVLHDAPQAVVGVGPDGRVVEWNPAAEALLGLPAAEVVGHPLTDVEALGGLPADADAADVVLHDGRLLDCRAVSAGGAGRAWFLRDATRQRRLDEQQRFLVEAGAELPSGLETDATLRRIAELAVPRLADWCMVYLAEEDGGVRRVTIASADEAVDPLAATAATAATHPDIDPHADAGVPLVIRTGRPLLVPETTPEAIAADASDPTAQVELIRDLDLRSWICVPLTVAGETFGALSLVTARSGRTYTEDDLAFAEQVGVRAAAALDNARRYGRQHAAAEELQRALLPEGLPEVPGATLAARYVPGSPGAQVGGDWYDALRIGDSRVALAIGDVAGRGVRAAAVMGQLRTALRAYALEGHAPEVAMTRLGQFVDALGEAAELATALCLVLDVRDGALQVACAGHPPPLVVEPDGTTRFVTTRSAPPLGATGVRPAGDADVLRPGATIVLYTDGLVERRDESLAVGLERLAAAAAGRGADPEALCDHLLAALLPPGARPDDVAVIALHRAA